MLGRFVDHDGNQRNRPVVRFGHIAMLPEPIKTPRGTTQESFLVEVLSLSGFSGSPVFAHPPSMLTWQQTIDYGGCLLGVDWGHIGGRECIRDATRDEPDNLIAEKWYVKQNSGFIGVVPAWKINETLESDDMKEKSDAYLKSGADETQHAELEVSRENDGPGGLECTGDLTRGLLQVSKKELDEKRKEQDG